MQTLAKVCVVAAAVVFALAAVELAVRILLGLGWVSDAATLRIVGTHCDMIYDSLLGWNNPSGAVMKDEWGGMDVIINSMGFRDREYAEQKPDGVFRILVLGDSFTWGLGVSQEEIYTEVLESMLNQTLEGSPRVEVINAGISGFGTDQEYLLLQRWAKRLAPDLVVLFFYENDIHNNISSFQYHAPKPIFYARNDRLVLHNVPVPRIVLDEKEELYLIESCSMLENLASFRVALTRAQTNYRVCAVLDALGLVDLSPPWGYVNMTDSKQLTLRLIQAMRQQSKAVEAAFTVVYCPPSTNLTPQDYAMASEPPALVAELEKHQIPCLDLFAEFKARNVSGDAIRIKRPLQEKPDLHFNPAGHRLEAEILHRYILDAGWIPAPR